MPSITFDVEDEAYFKEKNKTVDEVKKEISKLVNDYLDNL